ncbi:hypothetical protein LJC24_01430 [Desulfococcaceae bacterium OttesenSCG-928-F15]|nr:hypothetical protein [Desulfococcaceae bacterium OttesenSCG-928-F15]
MGLLFIIAAIIGAILILIFGTGIAVIDLLVDGIYAFIGKSKKEKSE